MYKSYCNIEKVLKQIMLFFNYCELGRGGGGWGAKTAEKKKEFLFSKNCKIWQELKRKKKEIICSRKFNFSGCISLLENYFMPFWFLIKKSDWKFTIPYFLLLIFTSKFTTITSNFHISQCHSPIGEYPLVSTFKRTWRMWNCGSI